MLIATQCFGLSSQSGGARIMRALLSNPPAPTLSVSLSQMLPSPTSVVPELGIRTRPLLGRIEKTRFGGLASLLDRPYASSACRKLKAVCLENKACAMHALTHGYGFVIAHQVARELHLPFFVSVHDDMSYMMKGHPDLQRVLDEIKAAWPEASERYVISREIGEEYNARYGRASYEIVTDGLDHIHPPRANLRQSKTIYFMGLVHNSYRPNFEALCQALALLNKGEDEHWSIIVRSGVTSFSFESAHSLVRFLPFGSEDDVESDMYNAGLLYLPLPFGEQAKEFVRFSLSTKMVTYLGSGLPILYHGPDDAAASSLLSKNHAAAMAHSLNPICLADTIRSAHTNATMLAKAAGELGKTSFLLSTQRDRFWTPILEMCKANALQLPA